MKTFFLMLLFSTVSAQASIETIYKSLGVKLRLSSYFSDHSLEGNGFNLNEEGFNGKLRFPIVPVFKPKNFKYFISRIYFNLEIPTHSLNQAPGSDHNKNYIKSNFLSQSELAFTNSNPLWNVSSDLKTSSISLGYQLGLAASVGRKVQFLQLALGPTLGYINYSYTLNLCSKYTEAPDRINLMKISSGNCQDKRRIDEVDFKGLGLGFAANITLFELKFKKWGDLSPLFHTTIKLGLT